LGFNPPCINDARGIKVTIEKIKKKNERVLIFSGLIRK
jgi:hypothetical protein